MEGEELSRLRAHRRRTRDRAAAGAGSQATARRRPRAEHRRNGRVLARSRSSSGSPALIDDVVERVARPTLAAMRARGHAVHRSALRRPDAHGRRPEGRRVQLPIRRSGDAGSAPGDCDRRVADRADVHHRARRSICRTASRSPRLASAVTTVLAAPGYPEQPRTGDRIEIPRGAERRSRLSRRHEARRRRIARHGRRSRARRHRARRFTRRRTGGAARSSPPTFRSTGSSSARDIGWRELTRRAGAT